MQQIWNDDELLLSIDGNYYLNKNASNKFKKCYSQYLDDKYSNCLFELKWAKKVIQTYPPIIKENLIDEKKYILSDYEKKYSNQKINIYDLFEYIYNLSILLKRELSLDDLKKYGNLISEDFKFVDYSFEIFFNIKRYGLDDSINYTSDWYELLTILGVVKKCNMNNIIFNIKNLDDWLYKNGYYSKDKINIIKNFFDTLKCKKNAYYLSNEIIDYFKNKYDFDFAFKNGLSFNEQNKIFVNYNGSSDFILMIPKIFKLNINSIDDIEIYLNFIKKKFKLNYNAKKLKIYNNIISNNNIINFDFLLDNIINIEDLINVLAIPIKYELEVINFKIEKIDLWLSNNNYYDKKIIDFKNNFYDEIVFNEKKYYLSSEIVSYLNHKFINKSESKKLNNQDQEVYIIERHYKPVTEIKRKIMIFSLLTGTGIIACLYLKIILNKEPFNIALNCSTNYYKLLHSNSKYRDLLRKTGNLLYFFCELSNAYL